MEELIGGALVKALIEEARGGSHKSQYIRWLLGRVRGNREGKVYSHKAEDWKNADNVYRTPYRKDDKRYPVANAEPTDTHYAGWRPEDWNGRHPPFEVSRVKDKSKFVQRLMAEAGVRLKPKYKIPKEQMERIQKEKEERLDKEEEGPKAPQKKKYKLNPNLRKFPGITSKQMVDFRNRVGSPRSQNTFGELTNMGKFFGEPDFPDKFDTAKKLEPLVRAYEQAGKPRDAKGWYAEAFVEEEE